jgi:hypothetical protein
MTKFLGILALVTMAACTSESAEVVADTTVADTTVIVDSTVKTDTVTR